MGKRKATTKDGLTATQMQNYAINQIAAAGGRAWRNNTGAARIGNRFVRFGRRGSGDVLGVLPPNGQFISIEIKTTNDDMNEAQELFLFEMRELGAIVIIAETKADIDAALIPFTDAGDDERLVPETR